MINIPKGTKDVLPSEAYKWHFVENTARRISALYNLKEIRTPVFEHTELFLRGVGDTTDIVNKEMYTFLDKGERSITLKPEGTAGVVRSFIENGLASGVLPLKMYYIIPVFRYERPQAGRLREHHQFGVEIFGGKGPETDAEVILLARDYIAALGVENVELNLNSIGCKHCRPKFNEALKEYLRPHLSEMCPTCNARFEKNPLRILDCKEEACSKINAGAPKTVDFLCDECREHFERLKGILDSCGLVARKHSSDLYYILENFFRGTEFLCKPREVELRKGILIPAARFEPFHPAELYADELEISGGGIAEPFGLTEVKTAFGEVADLFFMLGPSGTVDMLVAESQENYEAIRRCNGLNDAVMVRLETFDFSEFYQRTGFRSGDFLRFEIESWADGRWNVSHVSRIDAPTPTEIKRWIDKFETALAAVCSDYKDSLEIHEQIEYAYVYASSSGNDLRRLPGPSIDLYQNMMRSISFRRDGSEWTLISNDDLEDIGDSHSSSGPGEGHVHSSACSCGESPSSLKRSVSVTAPNGSVTKLSILRRL